MSYSFETIRLEVGRRGVANIVLNRPAKHNALNSTMIDEFTRAVEALAKNQSVRVVLLSAEGASFCAGADLTWMREQFNADRNTRINQALRFSHLLQQLDNLPKLLIGVAQGHAYGGGVGLLCTCDIVLATPAVNFTLSENRLGIIPATIAPFVISRVGLANVRRYSLNGNPISAEEALAIGLVSELHDPQVLDNAVEHQIKLALACAPGAVAAAKGLFRRIATGLSTPTDTVEALADRWESAEAKQGIEAFFEKRKPPWAE